MKTLSLGIMCLVIGGLIGMSIAPAPKINESFDQVMSTMDMSTPKGDQGPASLAFAQANFKMHDSMAIEFSGNPDRDFAKGMIGHHQGAIDMAKIVLQYGKDEKIRKLAQDVITAQTGEIEFMSNWLKSVSSQSETEESSHQTKPHHE
jgi:uncharacterized protein (DUF305 family)